MQLAHALLSALKDYGAREAFTVRSDAALPLQRQIGRLGLLPHHALSSSQAAGFAADASARWHQGLSVAVVTTGTAALDIVSASTNANAGKSPVIFISASPSAVDSKAALDTPAAQGRFGKAKVSQAAVFRELTCAQAVLSDAASAPADIARVLAAARDLARPVYLEIPGELIAANIGPVPVLDAPMPDDKAVQACAKQIMTLLAASARPLLLLGPEVRRFGLEAKAGRLATQLGLAVATTLSTRGLLAGTDAPLIGTYAGSASDPAVRAQVETADLLVLAGVMLADSPFSLPERAHGHVVHAIDRAVRIDAQVTADIPLAALLDALSVLTNGLATPPGHAERTVRADYRRGLATDDQPLLAADIARGINDLFDGHGRMPIACEPGELLTMALDIVETPVIAIGDTAPVGAAIPAGLALQLASGQRPLILTRPDAFAMTGLELGHARRLQLNPIVLLVNSAASDGPRYAALAPPLGGRGHKAKTRSELKAALSASLADASCWHVIDAVVPSSPARTTP